LIQGQPGLATGKAMWENTGRGDNRAYFKKRILDQKQGAARFNPPK
jgi:hypothetical protein